MAYIVRKQGNANRELALWEVSRVCTLYSRGLSIESVARKTGISRTLVARILKEEGEGTRKKGEAA